jgi:glucose/mannose-6-phosphate isomerase
MNDVDRFAGPDPQDMRGQIEALPEQLEAGWELGMRQPSLAGGKPALVILAGMGGSAIGADLVAAHAGSMLPVPLIVWRGYDLPACAGPETLVVLSSHSGNTEETLSAYDAGRRASARLLAVTTGGELARRCDAAGIPVWRFEHRGQPRAAVGFSSALILAGLHRLGLVSDAGGDIHLAAQAMRDQQQVLRPESAVTRNPAKRMAGQLLDRMPLIVGGGLLAPVARRWRTQIAELAKAVAQFEELPEADHNMVAGVGQPESLITRTMAVFLRAGLDSPRLAARVEATRQVMMVEGFNTDVVDAAGMTRLAQQWTCLHYGDYVAYYLAMAYGVDPTPVAAIEDLKARLRD